jgi:hypothetical protein
MKVSLFKKTFGRLLGDLDLYKVLEDIKKGVYINEIVSLREVLKTGTKDAYNERKKKLACFTISGTFQENKNSEGVNIPPRISGLKKYNSIVGLDYDGLSGKQVDDLIRKCKQIEYTLAAFVSPSGKGAKVLVLTNSKNHKKHYELFQNVAAYYDDVLKEKHDSSGSNINRLCYVSSDKDMYLNRKAKAFGFVAKIEENQVRPELDFSKSVKGDDVGTYLAKAVERMDNRGLYYVNGSRHPYVKGFAVECWNYGIKEADCWGFLDSNFVTAQCDSKMLKNLVFSIYNGGHLNQEFGFYLNWTKNNRPTGEKSKPTKKVKTEPKEKTVKLHEETEGDVAAIALPEMDDEDLFENLPTSVANKIYQFKKVEESLNEYFEFRINTLKRQAEYKQKKSDGCNGWKKFRVLDEIEYNSIVRGLLRSGVSTNFNQVKQIVRSHFSKQVNPLRGIIEDSLAVLGDDKTDYIAKLASVVKTTAPADLWGRIFKKWLVASVANAYVENNCTNHQCLILISEKQGLGKTTFWSSLFDRDYTYIGHIDTRNKDSQLMLTDTLIICLDEQLSVLENQRDLEGLKSTITLPRVKERVHYGKQNQFIPRVANFCGTANDKGILRDETGNRRFLPFEVKDKIDMNQVSQSDIVKAWGQALKLYREGWYYLPTKVENNEIEKYQEQFRKLDDVHYFIKELYTPYVAKEETVLSTEHLLTSAEILESINKRFKLKDVTVKKVGAAMKLLGFKQRDLTRKKDKRRARFWSVKLGYESE